MSKEASPPAPPGVVSVIAMFQQSTTTAVYRLQFPVRDDKTNAIAAEKAGMTAAPLRGP